MPVPKSTRLSIDVSINLIIKRMITCLKSLFQSSFKIDLYDFRHCVVFQKVNCLKFEILDYHLYFTLCCSFNSLALDFL